MRHPLRLPFLLPVLAAVLGAPTTATAQLRVLERAQHTAIEGFETLPANLGYYDRSRGTVVVHGAGASQATWEWSGEGEFARSGTTRGLAIPLASLKKPLAAACGSWAQSRPMRSADSSALRHQA